MKVFDDFLKYHLKNYTKFRNNPNFTAQSNLSPWLHSGQISAQKVIYVSREACKNNPVMVNKFISELFVWR